jgi:hypothetical protein
MTVADLKYLLEGLPEDMDVVMPLPDGEGFVTVCGEKSGQASIAVAPPEASDADIDTMDDDDFDEVVVLLLEPCDCSVDVPVSTDNLNLN